MCWTSERNMIYISKKFSEVLKGSKRFKMIWDHFKYTPILILQILVMRVFNVIENLMMILNGYLTLADMFYKTIC